MLTVQIFDQKKFKVSRCLYRLSPHLFHVAHPINSNQRKDQGFLGVINIRVAGVIDLDLGADGEFLESQPLQSAKLTRTTLAFSSPFSLWQKRSPAN